MDGVATKQAGAMRRKAQQESAAKEQQCYHRTRGTQASTQNIRTFVTASPRYRSPRSWWPRVGCVGCNRRVCARRRADCGRHNPC
eukprot:348378-Amphidinium_carterae.1